MRRSDEDGPVVDLIHRMLEQGRPKDAQTVVFTVRDACNGEAGHKLLKMLETVTIQTLVPIHADTRALTARNAQSFIAHDLRRVMSDEFDNVAKLEKSPAVGK